MKMRTKISFQKIKNIFNLFIIVSIVYIFISLYVYINYEDKTIPTTLNLSSNNISFEKQICVVTSIVQRKTKSGDEIIYYRDMLNSLPSELYIIVRTEIPLKFDEFDRKPDEIIPVNDYPQLEKLNNPEYIPTHGDTLSRTKWRSKQSLDMAYILSYGAKRFDYVLFLEDDTMAIETTSLLLWLNEFIYNHKTDSTWGFSHLEHNSKIFQDKSEISYGGGGATALIMPSRQVNIFVPYLRRYFDKSPCDWLLRDFVIENNLKVYGSSPSLFKHMGKTSSLTEKN